MRDGLIDEITRVDAAGGIVEERVAGASRLHHCDGLRCIDDVDRFLESDAARGASGSAISGGTLYKYVFVGAIVGLSPSFLPLGVAARRAIPPVLIAHVAQISRRLEGGAICLQLHEPNAFIFGIVPVFDGCGEGAFVLGLVESERGADLPQVI